MSIHLSSEEVFCSFLLLWLNEQSNSSTSLNGFRTATTVSMSFCNNDTVQYILWECYGILLWDSVKIHCNKSMLKKKPSCFKAWRNPRVVGVRRA